METGLGIVQDFSVRNVALRKLAFTWDHLPRAECSGETSPEQIRDHSSLRLVSLKDQAHTFQLDHTSSAALRCGILSTAQINSIRSSRDGSSGALSWRQIALAYPEKGNQLHKLAAKVYGFRSVRVCQIGTLIYNKKLSEVLSSRDWKALFDRCIVPIIEYRKVPKLVERHLLASSDPGSRHVRNITNEIRLTRTELVFVPESAISKLQKLLVTNIPVLGIDPSITRRMDLQKQRDDSSLAGGRRAA